MEIFIKTGGLVLTKSCRTIPLFSNQNSTQISKSKFGITIEFAKSLRGRREHLAFKPKCRSLIFLDKTNEELTLSGSE